ncbi:MAG: tRNA (adenosine(37)-N6)-threonylcarbamoyltransferase complex dimerization subunit type 1 TsaB, partial [Cruoricaptor ignavus]|nr:tRNA (adenosine(37)-N6)-threonylcarbamoyltransferase complex dimerization subunit type 1 TsaB [Cruoricaptor ignavus]
MKILYLETSSRNCSVAISEDDKLLCLCEETSENYKQSESLHTFVEWALEGAEISLKEIEAVALGKGPGSYTGLRIGASTAKGFCFGLGVPLVTINSMETMVEPFLGQGYDYIIPLVDARRMEVYTAVYNGTTGEEIEETTNLILDENSFCNYAEKHVLFVGDGCTKAQELLSIKADYDAKVFPSAQYLIRKSLEKIKNNETENVAYF